MTASLNQCLKLAKQIEEIEDVLHEHAAHGRISEISTGSEKTGYFTPSEDQILRQLRRLKLKYETLSCAVVLGNSDIPSQSRGPIRPRF